MNAYYLGFVNREDVALIFALFLSSIVLKRSLIGVQQRESTKFLVHLDGFTSHSLLYRLSDNPR